MKIVFFKIVMYAATILLAIGGSLATHAAQKKVSLAVPGYVTLNPANRCILQVPCTNIPGPICTAIVSGISYQAWGKALSTDTLCEIVRYKIPG